MVLTVRSLSIAVLSITLTWSHILGPVIFTLYILQQYGINFHSYTDDTQLYLSMKPEETQPLVKLQASLIDIKSWMPSNFILLNSNKMEVVVFDLNPLRNGLNHIISLDGIFLASSVTLRNLGVTFDQDLIFNAK